MIIPLSLYRALIRAHALQRPFRTLLSIAGVALGVLASVAIGTANIQVLRSFEQAVTTVAGPATLEITGHDLGVDEAAITAVRAVEGVVSAAPVIEESVVVAQGNLAGQALQVLGLDLLAEAGARGFRIAQADDDVALEALLAPDALYLGRQVAADWNLKAGSLVEVTAGGRVVQLRVAGLIHHEAVGTSLWDRLAVMDIAAAQLLFQSVGRLDRIELVTTPNRPLDDIVASLRRHGYSDVEVRVSLQPAWSTDWITEEGRRKLAEAGYSPPGPTPRRASGPIPLTLTTRPRAVTCPQCGSEQTRLISEFGATLCKAHYQCGTCGEPFDHVKEI